MPDPRYTDPINDPRRPRPRDPAEFRPGRVDDTGRTTIWAWIIGVITVIVIAMLVYDYSRPSSTAAGNQPSASSPTTTGAAPANTPNTTPPASPTTSAPATPSPGSPTPATPSTPH